MKRREAPSGVSLADVKATMAALIPFAPPAHPMGSAGRFGRFQMWPSTVSVSHAGSLYREAAVAGELWCWVEASGHSTAVHS